MNTGQIKKHRSIDIVNETLQSCKDEILEYAVFYDGSFFQLPSKEFLEDYLIKLQNTIENYERVKTFVTSENINLSTCTHKTVADAIKGNEIKRAVCDLYLIYDAHIDCLKIGKTANIKNRLSTLQTSTPHKLQLVDLVTGGGIWEEEVQEMFKKYKISGEWFRYDRSIVDFFEDLNQKAK